MIRVLKNKYDNIYNLKVKGKVLTRMEFATSNGGVCVICL